MSPVEGDAVTPYTSQHTMQEAGERFMVHEGPSKSDRGFKFWMVIVANFTVDVVSVLDLSAVSTCLPTIVQDLHGDDFVWAGGAYTIASTAVLPLVGGLVSIFGRKPIFIGFILCLAIGSAICGAAQNMTMFLVGRVIQGIGGGGCLSVSKIIFSDIIPLPEQPKFQGILSCAWAIGCSSGPPIGGALAEAGAWRWLFYLNLPLLGIGAALVSAFLKIRTPRSSFREKMAQMDWIGNILLIGSTVAVLMGLTWGGLRFPWASAHVLTPLIVGAVGIVVFIVAELFFIKEPMVPTYCFTNRTTVSGYLGTFFHGLVTLAGIYYLPVYFQASKRATAVSSGADMLGVAIVLPVSAMATGVAIGKLKRYRPQCYVGWACILIGFGVLSLLDENSTTAQYVCSQIPLGIGYGIVWVSTQIALLAPLPISNNAHALGFYMFTRLFAQCWGIVIGGTILQNQLQKTLPAAFIKSIPSGVEVAYAIIPKIPSIDQPLQDEVRHAFAKSVAFIWKVMIAFAGAGFLSTLLMEEIPLRNAMDERWGMKDDKGSNGELQTKEALTVQEVGV